MDPILLTPPVLALSPMVSGLLGVAFLGCSLLLILTVLIQRPQGGGLSGAFGSGAGSGETAFGARTGDALTIATIGFFILWLVMAITLVFATRPPSVSPTVPAAQTGAPVEDLPAGSPASPDPTPPVPVDEDAAPGTPEPEDPANPDEQPAEPPADGPDPE